MNRLLIAILLISMGAIADDGAARIQQPARASIEENGGHNDWRTLDELWNETKAGADIKMALVNGTPSLEFLVGYEFADDDGNPADSAHALLTRTRLNYLTGRYEGFDAFVQAQYVGPIGDHYNHADGGDPDYDVINDPDDARFHQAYLAYTGYESVARIGAQEIILDNARFIGNVGWRFNAQSFNAASVANHSISNLTLYYAYINSINGIDGSINHDREYHVFNGEYELDDGLKLAGFAYLQRNDNTPLEEEIDTFGLRLWGQNDSFAHEAMVAFQRSAYYGYLKLNMKAADLNLGIGCEYISGGGTGIDDEKRFQTLNGTAHKFNGWADQFLGTGIGLPSGLVDVWAETTVQASEKVQIFGAYHFFNTAANTGAGSFSGIYGHELDLMAKYPVCKNFDAMLAMAYYLQGDDDATNFTDDKAVVWLRGTLRF